MGKGGKGKGGGVASEVPAVLVKLLGSDFVSGTAGKEVQSTLARETGGQFFYAMSRKEWPEFRHFPYVFRPSPRTRNEYDPQEVFGTGVNPADLSPQEICDAWLSRPIQWELVDINKTKGNSPGLVLTRTKQGEQLKDLHRLQLDAWQAEPGERNVDVVYCPTAWSSGPPMGHAIAVPRGREELLSRMLSGTLRHAAERMGISMGRDGYVVLRDILRHPEYVGKFGAIHPLEVRCLVEANRKQRFQISGPEEGEPEDSLRIRCTQGHSVKIVSAEETMTAVASIEHYLQLAGLASYADRAVVAAQHRDDFLVLSSGSTPNSRTSSQVLLPRSSSAHSQPGPYSSPSRSPPLQPLNASRALTISEKAAATAARRVAAYAAAHGASSTCSPPVPLQHPVLPPPGGLSQQVEAQPRPLAVIVHGTFQKSLSKILETGGLHKMERNHIHFCQALPEHGGVVSGMRPEATVVIEVDIAKAIRDGIRFYVSANGVVLTDGVRGGWLPTEYFSRVFDRKTGKDHKIWRKFLSDQNRDDPDTIREQRRRARE